jgi:predicted small metal-binding protein
MKKSYLSVFSLGASLIFVAAGIAQTQTEREPAKEPMVKEPMVLKSVSCPPECGFTCRSHDEKEIIQIVKSHALSAHGKVLTDDQIKGMMQVEKMPAQTTAPMPAPEKKS